MRECRPDFTRAPAHVRGTRDIDSTRHVVRVLLSFAVNCKRNRIKEQKRGKKSLIFDRTTGGDGNRGKSHDRRNRCSCKRADNRSCNNGESALPKSPPSSLTRNLARQSRQPDVSARVKPGQVLRIAPTHRTDRISETHRVAECILPSSCHNCLRNCSRLHESTDFVPKLCTSSCFCLFVNFPTTLCPKNVVGRCIGTFHY